MSDTLSAFLVIGAIVLVAGAVLAAAIMRAAWAHREREALTSSDLRAVEESAMLLIEQLKNEADRALAEMETRRNELSRLVAEADSRIDTLRNLAPGEESALRESAIHSMGFAAEAGASDTHFDTAQIVRLAAKGMDPVEIARATGLDCADVKVALKLGQIRQ